MRSIKSLMIGVILTFASMYVCLAQKTYDIVGTLRNPTKGEIIYLKNSDNGQILDTTTVAANGGFAFRGVVTRPFIATIIADSSWVDAIIEAGNIEMTLDGAHSSVVRGTLLNRGAQQFRDLMSKSVAEYNELEDHLTMDLELPADTVEIRLAEFIAARDSVNNGYVESLYNANRDNILGTYLLFCWADVMAPEQFAPIWQKASNETKNFVPLQRVANANVAKLFNAVGSKFPDCLLQNTAKQPVNIAHIFDGKTVVLINFWASWCDFCKANETEISALTQKFPTQIRIINISIADSPEKALEAIAAKPYEGEYLLDVDNTAQKLYGIDIFPTTLLISPEGQVVMRHEGVLTQAVENAIRETLKIN